MRDINIVLQENYDIVKSIGYNIIGIFLQGSQNYNLAYEDSDIDCKAIIVPSLDDIVFNRKPVSITHILPNDEHIDIKDIRLMFNNFKKQNINFVEILFTPYKILNAEYEVILNPIFKNNEKIARYDNYKTVNSIAGMTYEKYKALEHPYPSLVDKIEKFGYDPKQLHHIIRLNKFMKDWISGKNYSDCLISSDREFMLNVKKELTYSLGDARWIAKTYTDEAKVIKDKYIESNPPYISLEVEKILDEVMSEVIRYALKQEI